MSTPQLSGIIARQIGSIQGKLVSQVQSQVFNVLSKFTNQCPSAKELEKIVKIKNNLLKNINALERRVQKLRSVAEKLDGVISTVKVSIQVIKLLPIPTAIIPPQVGGVGIPVSVLTRYSDGLIRLNKVLDALEADKAGILGVITIASNTLTGLKARLEAIDLAIQKCVNDLATTQPSTTPQIIATIQPPGNVESEDTSSSDFFYKGLTLEIVQDPNSPVIAPKRYAIAKDKIGVIVLYGPSSFSSDTQVLLDEIKFRIDNQIP
jgi:hypothetical protein